MTLGFILFMFFFTILVSISKKQDFFAKTCRKTFKNKGEFYFTVIKETFARRNFHGDEFRKLSWT